MREQFDNYLNNNVVSRASGVFPFLSIYCADSDIYSDTDRNGKKWEEGKSNPVVVIGTCWLTFSVYPNKPKCEWFPKSLRSAHGSLSMRLRDPLKARGQFWRFKHIAFIQDNEEYVYVNIVSFEQPPSSHQQKESVREWRSKIWFSF